MGKSPVAFPFIKILLHIKAREDKKEAMKNKIIVLSLILVMSLYLIACGNQSTTSEPEPQTEQISTETEATETETSSLEDETTETEFIEETDTSTSEYLSESDEISHSKWADINGAWDAVHQFTLYAREQGADYTDGWCWCYDHGKGAGDQPSYAVYMKEGDPLYGTVYHVGDYLPDGTQFSGTNDEWEAFIKQDFEKLLTEDGSVSFKDPETGRTIIGTQEEIDAYKASKGYNNSNTGNSNGGASNNTTSQPAQSSEEQTVTGPTGDGSGSSRENRGNAGANSGTVGGGNLQ